MEPTSVPPEVQSPGLSTLQRENDTDPAGVAVPPVILTKAESATARTPVPIDAPPAGTFAVVSGSVDVSTTLGVVTVVELQLLIGGAVLRMVSL